MAYIDGFLAAVPEDNKAAYVTFAQAAADVFRANGAIRVVENWGETVPEGEVTSFPMAVKREKGETVVFSWIEWPSKAARDAGWDKVMADPLFQEDGMEMPFDGKRMIFGGFETVLDQGAQG